MVNSKKVDVPDQNSGPDYLAGRQEWLERYGSYIARARNWRLAAFVFAGVCVIEAFGLVHEADRVKTIPFVVEVNKLGESVRLAQAVQAGDFNGDNAITRHVLAHWVNLVFSRIPDNHAEEERVLSTYHFATQDSQRALNTYFKTHNPYSAQGFRDVQVNTSLPMAGTKNVWQVTWTATQYGSAKDGDPILWRKRYSATIQIAISPPTSTKVAENNPFGIYIT
ncbi:type IV secretion system protein [Acidithiobacillus ferrivorans]|nr:type IV secretion system protein [Acidithiobacillus ferrivorans]